MQNLEKIEEVSSMTIYRVKNPEKVYEVLKKLKLESKYFAILINGKKVLLVDDVYTTGATIQECAKVLKKFNAESVVGFSIARG